MNIAKSLPALNASLAVPLPASPTRVPGGIPELFDAPIAARDDMGLWRRARRARREWREQRYARLIGG